MSHSITSRRTPPGGSTTLTGGATTAGGAAGPAVTRGRLAGIWAGIRRGLPTVMVMAALASLAWWGHESDWTLPKFSALVGGGSTPEEEWCAAHNVAESECIECNATLASPVKDFGWCKVHGIPQCPLEHPEVAQLRSVPTVSEEDMSQAARALALLPRIENNSLCRLHQKRVQFASIEALEKTGVDIAVVQKRPVTEAVMTVGEVVYDDTRTAHLASRVPGTVWQVERQVGDRVHKGDILALVDAAAVGRAKTELLQAITQFRLAKENHERIESLVTRGATPERSYRESKAGLDEAHVTLLSAQQALVNLGFVVNVDEFAELPSAEIAERIRFLGLPTATVASMSDEKTSNLYPLRSPLDGVVVECKVVAGEVVDIAQMLFSVADTSRMWLTLDVRQDDAQYVSLGQRVLFQPSDRHGEGEVQGVVRWISTAADDQTRTVKVRVDLPNEDGRLRANTFGTGRIVLREEPQAVVIPRQAVHWDGCCNVVFVRDKDFLKEGAPKFFHVRKVRLGFQDQGTVEIIAGLMPGEVIASKNSVVLEAQLLKSNLGAGCGCADGHH